MVQQKLEPNTPITDVACPVCGGPVTVVSGKRPGDLLKGRCFNQLEDEKVCATWFTVGTNPSYLLKQNFLKAMIESADNDNSTENTDEAANVNEEESSSGTEIEETGTEQKDARTEEGNTEAGTGRDNTTSDTGASPRTRKRKGIFKG